jgi:hypothetical protein
MSSFEFVTVLVAVIVGLGISHLLVGLGRAIHDRKIASIWWVQILWTITVFEYLSLFWWNLYYTNSDSSWSQAEYLYYLSHAALPFFCAVLLYRPGAGAAVDMRASFEANRQWFLGVWSLLMIVDVPTTALQGNLFSPWYYLPTIGTLFVLSVVGIFTPNLRYQGFIATVFVVFGIAWPIIVRGVLPTLG